MININLVPEYIKKEQLLRRLLDHNLKLVAIFGFAILISGATLVYSRIALEMMHQNYLDQENLIISNAKQYNSKVNEINNRINTISKIQLENFNWPSFLNAFGNLVPNGIRIVAIDLNHQTEKVSIMGVAKTRDDLLAFRDGLIKSGMITGYDFPLSVLLQKEDIKFEISTAVKSWTLN